MILVSFDVFRLCVLCLMWVWNRFEVGLVSWMDVVVGMD